MGEWKKYPLKSLGNVITGKTPSINNPEDWGDQMPFITPSDYKNYLKKATSSIRGLSKEGIEKLKNKILPPKSVLVTCIGSDMGKVVMNAVEVITNQQINSIIPHGDSIDNDFLYYSLVAMYDFLRVYGGDGTAVPIVNKGDFEKLEIFRPTLTEQKAIASVLSCLDDKIDLLHRQNKTLEAIAETLFRQWFLEEAGGEIDTTLAEFAENIKENVKVEALGELKHYIGLEHIPRKCIELSIWGKPHELTSNKSAFIERDILFGKLRPYFHKVVFAPIDGVCSTDILVIRPKKKEWFAFCLFWFFSKEVVDHSNLGSGGTRMPRTNWDIVSSYPIPKPEIESIEKYNEIAQPMISQISSNIFQIHTLEKLRDTLLPKLMSGEIRVEYEN